MKQSYATILAISGVIMVAFSAHVLANGPITLFPPPNMASCNSTTALMFDGANPVRCESPVPTGGVMPFNLAACPTGWTPLAGMSGRTVIGVGAYAEVSAGSVSQPFSTNYAVGATGGSATTALTMNQMPKHSHNARFTGPPDDHYLNSLDTEDVSRQGYVEFDYLDANVGNVNIVEPFQANSPGHSLMGARGDGAGPFISNSLTGGDPTSTEGQAAPVDTRPPYVALLYCQKN